MSAQIVTKDQFIIPPDRQRKLFDAQAMQELSNTIAAKGLMHALVMRETDDGLALVAGERRMRAIDDMRMLGGVLKYNGEIINDGYPYVTLGQLTPLQAEEAELEENLLRENLTWQENAAAMAKLHSLRSRQAQAEGRVHTVADTAMETKGRSDGGYQAAVRKDLVVANYLHVPEVAKAKSADEAFKILKRHEETQKNQQLAATVGKTFNQSIHEAHHVNCLTWMRQADPAIVDVILTDPPYGMGADQFGDGGGGRLANNEHHYKDDLEGWRTLMQEWCPLSYRVAKAEAHAYVFCDLDNFHELKRLMEAAGWFVTRTPFICTKPNSGRVPHPEYGPRRQWEMILYAVKGKKNTTAIYPAVITHPADAGLQHGAQKPVALYVDLLKRSVQPGNVVLDTFMGSGTIFPAAHQFKVKAIGLEQSAEYYGISLKRLQGLEPPSQAAEGQALLNELAAMISSGA